jgi:hypothetical protein
LDELKSCFQELNVSLTYEQIKELYHECDMDENKGIDFKEFIVLLAFVHLLEDQSDPATVSIKGSNFFKRNYVCCMLTVLGYTYIKFSFSRNYEITIFFSS